MTIETNLSATVFGEDASEGNGVFAEIGLILLGIHIAADFSFVTTFSEDLGVLADFSL